MENPLVDRLPRFPDAPSRITHEMESKDIIRLQRDLTTNALNLMDEGDKQRYDGLRNGYRRWEKAIIGTFMSIGINHLERFFKHPNVKSIRNGQWRSAFCSSDIRVTLTPRQGSSRGLSSAASAPRPSRGWHHTPPRGVEASAKNSGDGPLYPLESSKGHVNCSTDCKWP